VAAAKGTGTWGTDHKLARQHGRSMTHRFRDPSEEQPAGRSISHVAKPTASQSVGGFKDRRTQESLEINCVVGGWQPYRVTKGFGISGQPRVDVIEILKSPGPEGLERVATVERLER
jgi:hypothetical protein